MAVATSYSVFSQATVAVAGVSVAPVLAIPDNCFSITVINRGGTDVLWGTGAAGGALVIGASAGLCPANGLREISAGDLQERGSDLIRFDVAAGAPYTVYLEYHCSLAGRRTA